MTQSTLALSAITMEIVAQYTKVARGSNSIAAGRTKVLSGILGWAVSCYMILEKWNFFKTETKKGNINLATLYLLQAILYAGSGGTSLIASITYHIPWSHRIIGYLAKKTFSKAFTQSAVSVLTRILASRVLLLAVNFWLGIIILIIEGLILWLSNDELQDWLEYSALGIKNTEPGSYKNIQEQKQEFKKVLESMFSIDEQALEINIHNQIELKHDASDIPQDTEDNFNEYDALLLITKDFEQQKPLRLNILTEKLAKDQAAKRVTEEANAYLINGIDIPGIFRR